VSSVSEEVPGEAAAASKWFGSGSEGRRALGLWIDESATAVGDGSGDSSGDFGGALVGLSASRGGDCESTVSARRSPFNAWAAGAGCRGKPADADGPHGLTCPPGDGVLPTRRPSTPGDSASPLLARSEPFPATTPAGFVKS